MERQTPIMDAVAAVCSDAKAFFCMPGHKGDTGYFGGELLRCDLTELPGADNLQNPTGAIRQSQALHAKFIGADAVYYTTGGSTTAVLAMLSLFRGKKVIFPRGVHQSAANAISLFGVTPVFMDARPCDYPSVTKAEDVRAALRTHKDAAAVFVTYPNYFGLCCDIEAIAQLAHKAGIPLVADAAHAAHFAYSSLLPASPSHAGVDIWAESAHKTLPAMGQCACLCIGKNALVSQDAAQRALLSLQTTSPSYVLLASLDYAHAYMRDKGEHELYRIVNISRRLMEMIDALPGFKCSDISQTGAHDKDALKLIIDVSGTGHTGLAVSNCLASEGIYAETADLKSMLLMLSAGNTAQQLERFYEALRRIERIRSRNICFSPYSMPAPTKYSPNPRAFGNIEKVKLERCAGMVSACAAGIYPPGEAVVHRGQVISFEIAGYLLEARRQGFSLFGTEDDSIFIYKERQ